MPDLDLNSSGPAVEEVQEALKKLNFYGGGLDGIFGPATNAAVKAFQASKGLLVDGIVGPRTLNSLLGQDLPQGLPASTLAGIDVSHYQGKVDWQAVKAANISFAFAKATDGQAVVDPSFAANWPAMRNSGILRGAYHFFRPLQDPKAQAAAFCKTVGKLQSQDLPPVLDLEWAPDSQQDNQDAWGEIKDTASRLAAIQTWLDEVQAQCGLAPVIYTAKSFWADAAKLADSQQFSPGHRLWLARYRDTIGPGDLFGGWQAWSFWQYRVSNEDELAGIHGSVDLDRFQGSRADLLAMALP